MTVPRAPIHSATVTTYHPGAENLPRSAETSLHLRAYSVAQTSRIRTFGALAHDQGPKRGGHEATSKAFWDGPALMIRTETTHSKNEELEIVERWELSADGKILTTTSDVTTPVGTGHFKLVCEKEADH